MSPGENIQGAIDFVHAGGIHLMSYGTDHDGITLSRVHVADIVCEGGTPSLTNQRLVLNNTSNEFFERPMSIGFYYSQCQDWHHPGGMGNTWDKTIQRVGFDQYVREKAGPEIRQLLTEYGPISIFWWDTPRDMSKEAFDSLHSSTGLNPSIRHANVAAVSRKDQPCDAT